MHICISLHSCWRLSPFSSLSTSHFFIPFSYLIYIFEIISKLTSWYHSPWTNYRICIFIFKHFLSLCVSFLSLLHPYHLSMRNMNSNNIIIIMFEKITALYFLQNQFKINTFPTSFSLSLTNSLPPSFPFSRNHSVLLIYTNNNHLTLYFIYCFQILFSLIHFFFLNHIFCLRVSVQ